MPVCCIEAAGSFAQSLSGDELTLLKNMRKIKHRLFPRVRFFFSGKENMGPVSSSVNTQR